MNGVDGLGMLRVKDRNNEISRDIYMTCISMVRCTDEAAFVLHPPLHFRSFRNGSHLCTRIDGGGQLI